ncbi:hypothetical protein P872_20130 [Rhodonellum psychrophilum GCM71 = DSM 17998]|uniref:DUF983 domain-containing protein n=2 Tax=Rhodonellum TaxID=336827 RepID=U5C096_9BACT|nr:MULTISPECIES: DUF983 domain-containing protein [Rhodonellum]ERM81597.1 hypothetical protein P872_20130 [Rhodonellum psychrophilum GCM71 = DSM 17998]MDO9552997.1 DUF983 domain-containing protein [Rhodonellum sp.]
MKKVSLGAAMVLAKCPRCREGQIFPTSIISYRKLSDVHNHCPTCNAVLTPEPDFYYGAMYISYAFSVALVVNVLIVLNYLFDDPDVWVYVTTVLIGNLLLVPIMLRYSKVLYLNLVGKLKYDPDWKKLKA